MNPDDVTSKMVENTCEAVGIKEIIAAAFNAVVSDDSPITAEWLVKNGYGCYRPYGVYVLDDLNVWMNGVAAVYLNDNLLPTKTIGQLRALHAGLGIGVVK